MRRLAMMLLLACGGQAVDAPTDVQMAQQDVAQPQPRGWCCEDVRDGETVLECGWLALNETVTCYCDGIANPTAGTCRDTPDYVPGTVCSQQGLVCW